MLANKRVKTRTLQGGFRSILVKIVQEETASLWLRFYCMQPFMYLALLSGLLDASLATEG